MIMKHLHCCQAEADFKSVRFLTGYVRQGEAFVPGLGRSGGLAYYDGAPGDRPAYDWDAVKRPNETDSPLKRSADPRDDVTTKTLQAWIHLFRPQARRYSPSHKIGQAVFGNEL